MVNILFVIISMEMGGSEKLVHMLVSGIDRNRFNPVVAWFHGERPLEEFKKIDIPLYRIRKGKGFDFSAMRSMARIIRDNDIHVINAHHFMPFVYSYYGGKIVNSTRLYYTEHSAWELEKIPRRWQRIGSYLLRNIDRIIGVSDIVTEALCRKFGVPHSKCVTITNGININRFNGKKDLRVVVRKELGIKEGERVIGVVANLKKIKNHIFLLKAFKRLIDEYLIPAKLVIIGQGFENDPENTEKEIKNFITASDLCDKVLMLGYRNDTERLLSAMDIFCLTSRREGLPISLIEAMAAGLPVVGTDVEGIRDVIIHGENGFLVLQDDVDDLKRKLLALIQDKNLRKRLGSKSRSMAHEKYSFQGCLKEYEDLFLSTLETNDT